MLRSFWSMFLVVAGLPGLAGAAPLTSGFSVDRFEVSGGATVVDDFDDGVFPGISWYVACGGASEAGGALSIDSIGPGCFAEDLFLAGPVLGLFTTSTTITADYNLPLPAEGEFAGIQAGAPSGLDILGLTVARVGGLVFFSVNDEGGVQGSVQLLPADFPTTTLRLQIALAVDGAGLLIPTVLVFADGNPLFEAELAALALAPLELPSGHSFYSALVAGVVPEPAAASLLLAGLVAVGLAGRAPRSA